ncbi:MAG: hypothetical protein EA402_03050 [Planctomycetota bacterium]|nr:MAG: hypothetical protein EA402_03050 [Planctomycetota bacterium]
MSILDSMNASSGSWQRYLWRTWTGRMLLALGTLCAVLLFLGALPMFSAGPREQDLADGLGEARAPASLTVASFNLAHGRGASGHQVFTSRQRQVEHLQQTAELMQQHGVTLALLQEADGNSWWNRRKDLVLSLAQAFDWQTGPRGYQVQGFGLDYGNAIISRYALRQARARNWPGGWGAPPKGAVAAVLDFDGEPLTVVSIHLEPFQRWRRMRQARSLAEWLHGHSGHLLIAGDFNADWNRADDAVRLLAESLALEPWPGAETSPPTFWTGRRLDWILVSSGLEISEPRILADAPSDHAMVIAEIRRRADDS